MVKWFYPREMDRARPNKVRNPKYVNDVKKRVLANTDKKAYAYLADTPQLKERTLI